MIYQSTPDYYNDFIAHASHKYINKYKSKSGRWVYVYTQPKASDLPNPYTMMDEGMNYLRGKKNRAVSTAKKTVNSKLNSFYNKADATGAAARKKIQTTKSNTKKKIDSTLNSFYNKADATGAAARKKITSKVDQASNAYDKYTKKRKSVAAGKKLMKKHAQNKRVQRQVESDNAVYRRALSEAYKTIKRRKSK